MSSSEESDLILDADGEAEDPIARYRESGVTVLSAEGATYAVERKNRDLYCLLSNHHLYVLAGETNNLSLLAYKELLRRRGFKIEKPHEIGINFLRRLYRDLGEKLSKEAVERATTEATGQGKVSETQTEVIRLIMDAVSRKASDIHFAVHDEIGTIALRIHGDLYKVRERPAQNVFEMCATIYQSMCDIADPTYKPKAHQDARMNADFVGRCGLFGSRIASGPTDDGSRMVLRLLYDSGTSIPTLDQLGYLPEQISAIETMRRQTSGINILSGGTGSGKSTTLVSVLDAIITTAKNSNLSERTNTAEEYLGLSVVTIEDPPEYKIHGATQTPLIADKTDENSVKRGWQRAISACMRQDPDIMMVGEIRDAGSAKAAFDAALTGHGVWTTVHTTDAVGIMLRLKGLDVDTDRMLDPEIITGLINQSLAQKLCKHCCLTWEEGADTIEPDQRDRIEKYCLTSGVRLRGHGCKKCKGEGISGRMVIAEIITPNLEFMEVFAEHGKAKAKAYWVRSMQGITKCMALIRRVNEGLIDPREAEDKVCAMDKDMLTMSIDYSVAGDFEQGRNLLRPWSVLRIEKEAAEAKEAIARKAKYAEQRAQSEVAKLRAKEAEVKHGGKSAPLHSRPDTGALSIALTVTPTVTPTVQPCVISPTQSAAVEHTNSPATEKQSIQSAPLLAPITQTSSASLPENPAELKNSNEIKLQIDSLIPPSLAPVHPSSSTSKSSPNILLDDLADLVDANVD